MDKKINKRSMTKVGVIISLWILGPLFILVTNPEQLPLPLLIFPFLWLFCVIFLSAWLILRLNKGVPRRQAVIVAGVIASLPVMLMVFQSIHQLSFRDVLLTVALVFFTALYLLRADFIARL